MRKLLLSVLAAAAVVAVGLSHPGKEPAGFLSSPVAAATANPTATTAPWVYTQNDTSFADAYNNHCSGDPQDRGVFTGTGTRVTGITAVPVVGGYRIIIVCRGGNVLSTFLPLTDQFGISNGLKAVAIPAGAGNTVVSALPGKLDRLIVTTVGTTGILTCYDNATTNSGTVIGGLTAAQGAILWQTSVFESPTVNGITCVATASGPVVLAVYT